ncbi:MAG: esterase [Steroidobacteraceae bacterium]
MEHEALVVQRPTGRPLQLVLLFHGLGADEHDLRSVGERFGREYPQAFVVSLRAPEQSDLAFGYQWISPTGLDDARRIERVSAALPGFRRMVRHWQQESGLGADATVLVGFSQGAMMALEAVAGADGAGLAGRVVAISGRYARLPEAAPVGTTLFLMHGKADAVVHYGFTVEAAKHLVALGADVVADVLPFAGHEINEEMLELVIERLRTHIPRRVWDDALRGAPPDGGTQ